MELGEKIKKLRKEKKMTLEQLGEKVGVGKSTVRKWENGMISNMRRDKIAKLANALDTTPAWLMGWEDDEVTSDIKKNDTLNEMADEIHITILKHELGNVKFTDDEIQKIVEYAKFLLSQRKENENETHEN